MTVACQSLKDKSSPGGYQEQTFFIDNVCVSETLLQTKLHMPPLRPNVASRPRLVKRLNAGIDQGCRLILVSAPAGFGKTTLVE